MMNERRQLERRNMDLHQITKEMDNLSHTLIDLKTIAKCCEATLGSIKPRIGILEERQDRLAVDLAAATEKKPNES